MLIRIGVNADTGELKRVDSALGNIKTGAIALTAALTPVALGMNKIVMAGAEAEKRQIAFETMLGNVEDAKNLMESVRNLSLETPFKFGEAASTTRMLLAMGSTMETVIDDARMLGDVSAGLKVPMSRLALNFGQVRSAGQLTGRELRDFVVAGVPILDELSKITGRTSAQVKDMISQGDISFEMVSQAFKNMTSEGGKFNDLMAKTSKTTGGLISNFGVLVDLTVEDIGKNFNNRIMKNLLTNLFSWARENNNLKNTIEGLITAGTALAGVIALWGSGKMLIGLGKLTLALTGVGNAALLTQLKLLAIPILVGAAFLGLALVFEEVYRSIKDPELDSYFNRIRGWLEEKIPNGLKIFRGAVNLAFDTLFFTVRQSINGIQLLWQTLLVGLNKIPGIEIDTSGFDAALRKVNEEAAFFERRRTANFDLIAQGVRGAAAADMRPTGPMGPPAPTTVTGGVNITVNGAGNPTETAAAVKREIENLGNNLQRKTTSAGGATGAY